MPLPGNITNDNRESNVYLKDRFPFNGQKRIMPLSKKLKNKYLPIKADIQLHTVGDMSNDCRG